MRFLRFVIALLITGWMALSCHLWDEPDDRNYREEMRNFVIRISQYAAAYNHPFIIIPQNGVELITLSGEHDGELAREYLDGIDGLGQEDLRY